MKREIFVERLVGFSLARFVIGIFRIIRLALLCKCKMFQQMSP